MRKATIAAAAVFAGGLLCGLLATAHGQGNAPTGRVGSVNVAQLFAEYQRQKDLADEMKQFEDRSQLELQTRRGKLDEQQALLDKLDPKDPTYMEKMRNFTRMQLEFKNWFDLLQAEMGREAGMWTARIYQEINDAVAETARAQGYDIVLYHDQFQPRSSEPDAIREAITARKVLYVSPSVDLSQAVLQTLNTRYRAQPRQPMLSLPGAQP